MLKKLGHITYCDYINVITNTDKSTQYKILMDMLDDQSIAYMFAVYKRDYPQTCMHIPGMVEGVRTRCTNLNNDMSMEVIAKNGDLSVEVQQKEVSIFI